MCPTNGERRKLTLARMQERNERALQRARENRARALARAMILVNIYERARVEGQLPEQIHALGCPPLTLVSGGMGAGGNPHRLKTNKTAEKPSTFRSGPVVDMKTQVRSRFPCSGPYYCMVFWPGQLHNIPENIFVGPLTNVGMGLTSLLLILVSLFLGGQRCADALSISTLRVCVDMFTRTHHQIQIIGISFDLAMAKYAPVRTTFICSVECKLGTMHQHVLRV